MDVTGYRAPEMTVPSGLGTRPAGCPEPVRCSGLGRGLGAGFLAAGLTIIGMASAAAEGLTHGRFASTLILAQAEAPPEPVGEAPPEADRRPEIAVAADIGGVLTPGGTLVLEPSLRLSHAGTDRFTFRGIELVETVLVGIIEAEDADRNFIEAALTGRLGVTDWLEVEFRTPVVYRDDRTTTRIAQVDPPGPAITRELDAFNIGDVELAGHAQLNRVRPNRPVFVANLRFKFPTGRGPFDIDRDEDGIETELPTGSGFYGVEPSVTVLYPSDPVVFFANIGYLWNIKRDVDEQIAPDQFIGEVDPGDAVRAGLGMGFAVNEQTSFSLGYSHDYIFKTRTEVNDVTLRSETLQVGTFSVGFSHRFTPRVRADATIELGATQDATDASVLFRVPIAFQVF